MVRRRRRLEANLRYFVALARRFRLTLIFLSVLFIVTPTAFVWLYEGPEGQRIGYGKALHHVYFLMFGQPSLEYVDSVGVEALNFLVPPLAIVLVADGLVRFAYLYFAKHRSDKEWIEVISQTLKDHVVVCGAGRVGYRVATQLLSMGLDVVVIEKEESASFVSVLRDMKVPVLIENVKGPGSLKRVNVAAASAIVCATDDDLTNLNVALDARRAKPDIRVVIRLFDDDLVARVRDNFQAEALSSSALAAPALALAALDPRIVHSFHVGPHLMVVSQFHAKPPLVGLKISELRDRFGGLTLALRSKGAQEVLHPQGHVPIGEGDVLTVQAEYPDYLRVRAFTGEERAPMSAVRGG